MKIFGEEKAQASTEILVILGLAVVAAITVGFFLKNFVSQQVAPQIQQKL